MITIISFHCLEAVFIQDKLEIRGNPLCQRLQSWWNVDMHLSIYECVYLDACLMYQCLNYVTMCILSQVKGEVHQFYLTVKMKA